MKITRSMIAAAFVALPATAFAQGFEGAEVAANITLLPSDSGFGVTSYSGGVEFGLFSGISVELDLAAHDWRGISGRSRAATVHGLYEIMPETVVGLYVAEQRVGGGRISSYGIEGSTQIGALGLEGYLGTYDSGARTGATVGIDASYAFGRAFAATASVATIEADANMTAFSIGGEYQFGAGPVAFVDIGRQSAGGSDETFVTLGARIDLGSGVSFGSRSLSDMMPTGLVP